MEHSWDWDSDESFDEYLETLLNEKPTIEDLDAAIYKIEWDIKAVQSTVQQMQILCEVLRKKVAELK